MMSQLKVVGLVEFVKVRWQRYGVLIQVMSDSHPLGVKAEQKQLVRLEPEVRINLVVAQSYMHLESAGCCYFRPPSYWRNKAQQQPRNNIRKQRSTGSVDRCLGKITGMYLIICTNTGTSLSGTEDKYIIFEKLFWSMT